MHKSWLPPMNLSPANKDLLIMLFISMHLDKTSTNNGILLKWFLIPKRLINLLAFVLDESWFFAIIHCTLWRKHYFLLDFWVFKPNLSGEGGTFAPHFRWGYFRFRDFWSIFIKENYHNSRTSNDIDREPGPITKLDKRYTATSKKFTMTPCRQILMSLPIFQFMANLEQSRSRNPDVWSVELTLPLTVNFYLTKTENITKNSQTQLSHSCFE